MDPWMEERWAVDKKNLIPVEFGDQFQFRVVGHDHNGTAIVVPIDGDGNEMEFIHGPDGKLYLRRQ